MKTLTDAEIKCLLDTFSTGTEVNFFTINSSICYDKLENEGYVVDALPRIPVASKKYFAITDAGKEILEQQDPVRAVRACYEMFRYDLVKHFLSKVPRKKLVEFLVHDDGRVRELAKERFDSLQRNRGQYFNG